MKTVRAVSAIFFISVFCALVPRLAHCDNNDIWTLQGGGEYYNIDVAKIANNRDFRLYNSNVVLGNNAVTITTTTNGGYYGIKAPYFNGSGVTISTGSVILSSTTFSTAGYGYATIGVAVATTSVLGVADGTCLNGKVCYMFIGGYATVLTTGAVNPGDLLVSTTTTVGTLQGYAGANNSASNGTVIGKAIGKGTNAGGLTLAIISLQ